MRWWRPVCACRPCGRCGAWTTIWNLRDAACSHSLSTRHFHLRARAQCRPSTTYAYVQLNASRRARRRRASLQGPNRHIDDMACLRRQHVASPAAEATARRFAPGCCCSTNVNSSAHSARQGANAAAQCCSVAVTATHTTTPTRQQSDFRKQRRTRRRAGISVAPAVGCCKIGRRNPPDDTSSEGFMEPHRTHQRRASTQRNR